MVDNLDEMTIPIDEIREMDDDEVVELEESTHQQIHGEHACYGMSDLRTHQHLLTVMMERDLEDSNGNVPSKVCEE